MKYFEALRKHKIVDCKPEQVIFNYMRRSNASKKVDSSVLDEHLLEVSSFQEQLDTPVLNLKFCTSKSKDINILLAVISTLLFQESKLLSMKAELAQEAEKITQPQIKNYIKD